MLIGIDMGGTHIDGVAIKDNKIVKTIKHPVDRKDLYQTILNAIYDLISDLDKTQISRVNLSTTISTNAIVENKTTAVDLILQKGPGINFEFPEIAAEVNYIDGYVDHRGKMVKDLDYQQLAALKKELTQHQDLKQESNLAENLKHDLNTSQEKNLAVVTKFSTRNPEHEKAIAEYFANDYYQITQGHTLSGRLNFPRRVNTAYLNSAVYNIFQEFANNIAAALREVEIDAPIYILKADGGTMPLADAITRPVETILSGPAASFMGMSALFDNQMDSVLLDIGGTTTDIFFLVDGVPVFEPTGITIGKHKTLVRAIYSVSIGLGGDSCLSIVNSSANDDLAARIKIGPERKGPPLLFGGETPTLTDAMSVLHKLDFGHLSAEQVMLARQGITELAEQLSLSPEDFAEIVLTKAAQTVKNQVDSLLLRLNSQPVYTVREILADRQIKPAEVKVIGGPAKILAEYLEQEFKLNVLLPDQFQVANAIGAALAQPTIELNLLADTQRKILIIPELNIYEKIGSRYSLDEGRKYILRCLKQAAKELSDSKLATEIIEESSFNMVDGYSSGKNIRIKAQIKPGLSCAIEHE
ncbi:MAG: hydantoinase/oxoprolinase family protein [Clostridiaceae bacterium]|nr:hydantoinase/oxoprolinase family protein [Clostridiaceae bacterium]